MTTMMSDQEAERAAYAWLRQAYRDNFDVSWRGTWAEYVVRRQTPEPITTARRPIGAFRAAYAGGPASIISEDVYVAAAWEALTQPAQRAYREAFAKAMNWRNEQLKDWQTPYPINDPQVSKAAAMMIAAKDVRWDRWYPADAQFHAQFECADEGEFLSVKGWMWPQ